ncbi:polymorphic toxin-type HINT domain-containing protein [Polystyrenella longa]|uniref:polymorphic toxin-type HINT domain-containing protein n=1 Tax=Polystyrenella longa TaxID=2528007 RepID=UPI0018D255F2|nr:polymorphic toxin-type HINT domain-containing protein [Polystyrenella longa]
MTATFRHSGKKVLDVKIASEAASIGATPNHPFWSEDRQEFVRADELNLYERVRTLTGVSIVEQIRLRPGWHIVYNIEVKGEHVYHVGAGGVLVHNAVEDCSKYAKRMYRSKGGKVLRLRPNSKRGGVLGQLPNDDRHLLYHHDIHLRDGQVNTSNRTAMPIREWFEEYRELNNFGSLNELRRWLDITDVTPGQ